MSRLHVILKVAALALICAGILFLVFSVAAQAQTASCTSLSIGQAQNITAFSVCKKVTLNSVPTPSAGVAGICVPTNTTAAEWQSFYDNPPAGVAIAPCAASCTGYSYPLNGGCYYMSTSGNADSCNTVCAPYGGCNATTTKDVGSDDSSAARCSAVLTGITGVSITASGNNMASMYDGCTAQTLKGGWLGVNYYGGSPTNCTSAGAIGRVCGCNSGGGGGTAPCNLPWGGTTPHNTNVTAYLATTGSPGCTSQTRTCNNGNLSGSYQYASCTPGGGGNCGYDTFYYQNCIVDVGPQNNGTVQVWNQESCGYMGGVRATCTNGSYSYSNSSCSCFVGEALITMADGSKKRMDELKVGDKVKGQSRINTVIGIPVNKTGTTLYGFNGSKASVTGGHPFMTQHGWAAVKPDLSPKEGHTIEISKLVVGDTLNMDDGSTVTLDSITPENSGEHTVFNPMLDGDNTYYSNGILVHNKAPLC